MKYRLDCRHFRGEKPCDYARRCEGCPHYAPMGARILIVKLDAIGDVARTTPLLRPLRRKYDPCHITWLVAPAAEEMLRGNELIDVLLPYCAESLEPLRVQKFDLVLSLDKTARAAAVAMWVEAAEKLGFGLSEYGTVYPLTPDSEYAFDLGLDDELKYRRNTRTYQEVLFDCVRLPYAKEECALPIDDEARSYAHDFVAALGICNGEKLIALNLGGGQAFANKMWDAATAVEFLLKLQNAVPNKVLLFGGKRERRLIEKIMEAELLDVYSTGTANTIPQFQALLGRCDVVVTGDSLGMHLAIAERRPVIALFGPTCAQEIEIYGRGERIVSNVSCAPCYRSDCDKNPSCMESIDQGAVVEAVKRWLDEDA